MSSSEDRPFSSEDFSGKARLFPLPNLVLFPHVVQPLHAFEPRYRDLVEAALADDELIAMAILAPGWEQNYEGRPPLEPVGCLGRVIAHHRLTNGSYNFLLAGMQRIQILDELPPTLSFREATVEVLEDVDSLAASGDGALLRGKLKRAFFRIVPQLSHAQDQLQDLFSGEMSLGALADTISYVLDMDLRAKQALLAEVDVRRRTTLLLEHLAVCATDLEPGRAGALAFPPRFGVN